MEIFNSILVILGLCVFEIICSIDNAIINAEVLATMGQKARRWFLTWGLFFAVFMVRGGLPWFIVWFTVPTLGAWGALTATFNSDPAVAQAIEQSSPVILMAGGIFLVLLFFHWLFLEDKNFGLIGEKFFQSQGGWFYAIASLLITVVIWYAIKIDPMLAFGATGGSSAFFVTHGFKQFAEESEKKLMQKSGLSDISKILYLEVIDSTFSVDGVVGAFAFTMSVPLILLGNGLGALVLRELTIGNIDRIRSYRYLKNGAMYAILVLGSVMTLDAFGVHIPHYVSPVGTFAIVGWFLYKSVRHNKRSIAT